MNADGCQKKKSASSSSRCNKSQSMQPSIGRPIAVNVFAVFGIQVYSELGEEGGREPQDNPSDTSILTNFPIKTARCASSHVIACGHHST